MLVACPTSSHHRYCKKEFIEAVSSFTYPNYDILVAENSRDDGYLNELKQEGINVVKGPWLQGVIPRITASRNLLRDYFLKNGYDYYFSIDQDTIPPLDVIERLIRHDKQVVSGVYFNFHMVNGMPREMPVVWTDWDDATESMKYLDVRHLAKPQLMEVSAFGMGCVLIKKEVIEKIAFRYDQQKGGFEDVYFCYDARKLGYRLYIDTTVRCDHITVRGGKWKGESLY